MRFLLAILMSNFKKYGADPVKVVAVHGGPGATGEMAPVSKFLSGSFGILEPYQTGNSIKDQVEELKTTIKDHCQYPVVLIGFSWGAWLSILLTSFYPEPIKKLILIGCPPLDPKNAKLIPDTRLSRLNGKERTEYLSSLKSLQSDSDLNFDYNFQKLEKFTIKTDAFDPMPKFENEVVFNPSIFKKVWREAEELRKSGRLIRAIKTIHKPIVCIHGDHDPHPLEGIKSYFTEDEDKHELIILKNCGHKPWIERQASVEFYRILIQLIDKS